MPDNQSNDDIIILNQQTLKLSYDPTLKYTPPALAQPYFEKSLKKGQAKIAFDSVRAKPFEFARSHCKEEDIIEIKAGPFLYSETRALQDCILAGMPGVENEISSISLSIAVFSNEGLVLAGKRSHKVSRYASSWTIGLGEGLEDKDFLQGNIEPAIFRGLHEELNIVAKDLPCKVLALNFGGSSINILSVVDLRGLGEQYNAQNILVSAQHAHDAWEHSELVFIEPLDHALERLLGEDRKAPYVDEYFNLLQNEFFNTVRSKLKNV